MRGIVYWDARYFEKYGWELTSASRSSQDSDLLWNGPTVEDAVFYNSLRALQHERAFNLEGTDKFWLKINRGKESCRIAEVRSLGVGLVTIPADAKVRTIDWETFRASEATVEAVAKLDRISTKPFDEIAHRGNFAYYRHALPKGEISLPLTNSVDLNQPPLLTAIHYWNEQLPPYRQIRMKPLAFLEATSVPTTEVSRVPAMLKQHALSPLSPNIEEDFEVMKELIDGLPLIMNHTQDPEIVEWLLDEILRPSLEDEWDHGSRWGFATARDHLAKRLNEISAPGLRDQISEIVGFGKPTSQLQSTLE